MEIREIYRRFDKIGCCTFATIDGEYPETRIAHFIAYDEDGLYFTTMITKPFYRQLKDNGKVSVCGLCANSKVEEMSDGNLKFDNGYFIRLTGDVREVSFDSIKAKSNPVFDYCIKDQERYPAMTAFVIYRAKGEIFDYDFEKEYRDHKLERERFSYGNFPTIDPGLQITDACIGCGICRSVCTFDAIYQEGNRYRINGQRCDECGNCWNSCPANAIIHRGI